MLMQPHSIIYLLVVYSLNKRIANATSFHYLFIGGLDLMSAPEKSMCFLISPLRCTSSRITNSLDLVLEFSDNHL